MAELWHYKNGLFELRNEYLKRGLFYSILLFMFRRESIYQDDDVEKIFAARQWSFLKSRDLRSLVDWLPYI